MLPTRPSIRHIASQSKPTVKPRAHIRCAGTKIGKSLGTISQWTHEELAISHDYPLSITLSEKILPRLKERPKRKDTKQAPRMHLRPQIVSADLCDDVLKYIGSSLEKYKGCDVLDINPGACLWSQKLHDFLKPRKHVLLEPNTDDFQEFHDPLLVAPGSTYKLVSKDISRLETYKELVDEGVFPSQKRVDPADPHAQKLNNTLLVTGSLAWDPQLPGLGFSSMAKQLYHHFATAAWSNDLFHAFGPVRTLFWVENDDFSNMVAQSTSNMHRGNRLLEMMQQFEWVAGAERKERPVGRGSINREPQYELESIVHALRAGRKNGMYMPAHRQDFAHSFASQIEEASGGTGIASVEFIQSFLHDQQLQGNTPTGLNQQSQIEYTDMERQMRKDYPGAIILSPVQELEARSSAGAAKQGLPVPFLRKVNTMVHALKKKLIMEAIADIGEKLYALECTALKARDGPKKTALVQQVEATDQALEEALAEIEPRFQTQPASEVDDRISLRYPPHPRIQWDARPFEPLVSSDIEAWPRNRMSLISATPLPRPTIEDPNFHEWIQDFVSALYADSSKPLPQALDTLQHGLSDIVNECPSLRDPDRGGRMLLKHLRVRMLTMDMIIELTQAYMDWPFKAPGTDHSRFFRNRNSQSSRTT
ncbi:S-adenosyl-L-methionine-dependent methyltransferase [Setomelanomma holmii]|uniref:Mitochondrial transcription factor 1 n=1 Tax=Setomelanomma holmii TaxID=210430 RepID=A0A9P4HEG5_9PLEO|nr:S-adenosyl-L-methionine-dependent methyltransferase [Setomelanomma holmii]